MNNSCRLNEGLIFFLAKYVCQFIIVDLRLFSVYFIGMILVFLMSEGYKIIFSMNNSCRLNEG